MAKKSDVIDTGYPGIKQLKDGRYLVILDYGRQWKKDKNGELKLKQVKTQRIVNTMKEAKALQGENNQQKRFKKTSGITGKILFEDVMREYLDYKGKSWGISHKERQETHAKRAIAYFKGMDVREIEALDIEKFFDWCLCGEDFPVIGNNTVLKLKSQLNSLYEYMLKAPKRFCVTRNPVKDADAGPKDRFEGVALTEDELNALLDYIVKNEADTSIFCLVGLAALAGMRRGEICGLKWSDIDYDKKIIHVLRQRAETKSSPNGWTVLTPKGGKEKGRTADDRKERVTALPDCLAILLKTARKQQEAYGGATDDDYVYRTKVNVVDGYLSNPNKCSDNIRALQKRCGKVRKRAGKDPLPAFRLHDLRHTFVSLNLNHDVNFFQVAAAVGHTLTPREFGTTAVYLHDDENREDIVKCMDSLIHVSIPDEERLYLQKEYTSNRINKRNDEI